ncbi:MAG: NIPSNAP family protein [Acidobacteriota bacterium]
MNRRAFLWTALAGGALDASRSNLGAAAAVDRSWIELRFYRTRNDLERNRLDVFLKDGYLPAAQRAGVGPLGFFNVVVGPGMPTVLSVTAFRSLADMESAGAKMAGDAPWNKALDEFDSSPATAYQRIESCLLRAFRTVPKVEVPQASPDRPARFFELRVYEARNMRASEKKIKMFDEGEVAIFRKVGMLPIFFGQTMVGAGLPSLTYMLAYDSVEARETVWQKFLADPDWIKLRSMQGYADAEIVSNIHSTFLRPTAYSPIR